MASTASLGNCASGVPSNLFTIAALPNFPIAVTAFTGPIKAIAVSLSAPWWKRETLSPIFFITPSTFM